MLSIGTEIAFHTVVVVSTPPRSHILVLAAKRDSDHELIRIESEVLSRKDPPIELRLGDVNAVIPKKFVATDCVGVVAAIPAEPVTILDLSGTGSTTLFVSADVAEPLTAIDCFTTQLTVVIA